MHQDLFHAIQWVTDDGVPGTPYYIAAVMFCNDEAFDNFDEAKIAALLEKVEGLLCCAEADKLVHLSDEDGQWCLTMGGFEEFVCSDICKQKPRNRY
jgi:hypothetical protein